MTGVTIVFLLALLLLIALFALKYWERTHDRVLAPRMRVMADAQALRLKELVIAARIDLAKLPPFMLQLGRYFIHEGALALAKLARLGERQAHRLADRASYKYRFEKRETRSEFLKKVAEGKNGTPEELDTTSSNGQNS